MVLPARSEMTVPLDTARVAQAAFPQGNPYLTLRDEWGELYTAPTFAALFAASGRPAEAPGRVAGVLVLQFAEGLSDRQAAEAVRSRIDWKYLLGLELTDPGFEFSALSAFRARLRAGDVEQQWLDALLERLKARGVLKARSRQRTDATHVLAAIRILNRLEGGGESLRPALNALAREVPEGVQGQVPSECINAKLSGKCECRFKKIELRSQAVTQALGARAAFPYRFQH